MVWEHDKKKIIDEVRPGVSPELGTGLVGGWLVVNEYIPEELYEEINDLRGLIAAKMFGLVSRVRTGTPLKGYCDACPTRHIEIKNA